MYASDPYRFIAQLYSGYILFSPYYLKNKG